MRGGKANIDGLNCWNIHTQSHKTQNFLRKCGMHITIYKKCLYLCPILFIPCARSRTILFTQNGLYEEP